MEIFLVVVLILIALYFIPRIGNKIFSGIEKHQSFIAMDTFGSPAHFLSDFLDKLKSDFPKYKVLNENRGRYKIKFFSESFSLQLDFIYLINHIQVCMTFDSMIKRNIVKTFNCPYDQKAVEKEIMKKHMEVLGFPSSEVKTMIEQNYRETDVEEPIIEKTYYENGELKSETPFTDGKENGIQKNYFDHGNIESEIPYVHGKIHGIQKQYDYYGESYSEVTFVNGNSIGNLKAYYNDGKLVRETPFEFSYNGKEGDEKKYGTNGIEKIYHENGNLKSEIPIVYSLKHGIGKFYDELGNLVKTVEYVNNVEVPNSSMKIKVKTLPIGKNIVEIIECGLELSEHESNWNDRTPRLKIVLGNKKGKIIIYMNLRGYKNISDFESEEAPKGYEFRFVDNISEKVLVEKKTGKRIQSPERTAGLLEKVGNLANVAGIEMEEIDLDNFQDEIIGKTVGIIVGLNSNEQKEVWDFFHPSEMNES